jgi:hypothetical protein
MEKGVNAMGTFKGAAKGGAGLQKTQTDPRAIAAAAAVTSKPSASPPMDPAVLRNYARAVFGGKPVISTAQAVPVRSAGEIIRNRKELYERIRKVLGIVPVAPAQDFKIIK